MEQATATFDHGTEALVLFRAQQTIAQILSDTDSLQEAAPPLLRAIAEALEWEIGCLWVVSDDCTTLRCAEVWQISELAVEEFIAASREMALGSGVGLPGRVWNAGEPTWIPDIAEDTNFPRLGATRSRLHGAAALPITSLSKVVGVLEFFTSTTREFEQGTLDAMVMFGQQIGQFIERNRVQRHSHDDKALREAVLDSALDCVILIDHKGVVLEFNPAAQKTFGFSREEAIGRQMADLIIPPALREKHRQGMANYLKNGGQGKLLNRRVETVGVRADGSEFPVELTITLVDIDGPPKFAGYLRDISERKEAEERQAHLLRREQAARAHADKVKNRLSQVIELFSTSLDYETTIQEAAKIVVPEFADWCIVDILGADEQIRRLAIAHSDPQKEAFAWELQRRYPARTDALAGPAVVISSGKTQMRNDILPPIFRLLAHNEEHYEALCSLGMTSYLTVPLAAHRHLRGAITFAMDGHTRRFSAEDVKLAEDVVFACGLAIDNARLYRERNRVADTLQQSLLPTGLPGIAGIETAACFHPADKNNEVGGDFYDLYPNSENEWSIVIGDVCGKGADAAAMTALVRHTLRASSMYEREPNAILEFLNRAILQQRSDYCFCTAIYARLTTTATGSRIELSSAGHPLPLVLRGDGVVETVSDYGTVLGIVPDPQLTNFEITLAKGDSLLLYTDGVVEERASNHGRRTADLEASLRRHAGQDVEKIVAGIERDMLDRRKGHADDVAILALRQI